MYNNSGRSLAKNEEKEPCSTCLLHKKNKRIALSIYYLFFLGHCDSTRGIYDQTQELSAVYSNDIGVVNSMPDQNLAPPELVNHYHSPSTVVQHPPPSTNRQYGDLADNTGRSPPPIQSGNHSRNPIQKSVGWAEELQESYSETPYQESTSDLLTENSFGMMGVGEEYFFHILCVYFCNYVPSV